MARTAAAAEKVSGGAYKAGKYLVGEKMGLNKRAADWALAFRQEAVLARNEGKLFKSWAKRGQAAAASHAPEAAGAALGGAAVDFSVWDPQDERLSNLIQSVDGLANPVTDFLEMKETDSLAVGRIKQT